MSISQSLLPEFDHEMATTRKVLERVPDARANWKPHDKSFSMGALSQHIGTLVGWTTMTMTTTEFDGLCDQFRSPHLWERPNGQWKLRHPVQ